jgi:antitoxin ChpS
MNEVSIRRQGGAAIVTIPAEIMRRLDLTVGTRLALEVEGSAIVARPARRSRLKRYTLAELLEGVSNVDMEAVYADVADGLEGPSVGREFP